MEKKKKKIVVISYNCNHGLVYQRIHIAFKHLRDDFDFIFRELDDIHHTDMFYMDAAILVHPWCDNMMYLAGRIKKHYNIPVIVDLDDLLQKVPSDHPEYIYYRSAKVDQILMASDFAVFSTNYLKTKLGHLTKSSCVIENTLDPDVYRNWKPQNKIHKNCFIVGWTGAQSHRGDQYYTFLNGLCRFLTEFPDAKAYFHLLCPDELIRRFGSQIIFEPVACDFLDYPGFSSTYPFDICMVGLIPHEFNDAKSDLKLIEMSPHKIPLLSSPRPEFIRHKDKDIMLYADSDDEWYEQLKYAYHNKEKLNEMGERAYNYVMTERVSSKAAEAWREVLTKVIEFHKDS